MRAVSTKMCAPASDRTGPAPPDTAPRAVKLLEPSVHSGGSALCRPLLTRRQPGEHIRPACASRFIHIEKVDMAAWFAATSFLPMGEHAAVCVFRWLLGTQSVFLDCSRANALHGNSETCWFKPDGCGRQCFTASSQWTLQRWTAYPHRPTPPQLCTRAHTVGRRVADCLRIFQ